MSIDTTDVLIVGAGASGGVVARRLATAGLSVTCLEQGDWPDPSTYPAPDPAFELIARKQWSAAPNVRRLPVDYPINDDDSSIAPLMFNGVGGSTVLYAGDWPRLLPSDFRVRTLDGIADDWPITYEELVPYYERTDRAFGVSGLGGNPAYPPGEDPPYPPLPIGTAALRVARAHDALGWHWWPGPNAVLSVDAGNRRRCAQWSACMSGCPEGAKASTDLTHWPAAVAAGVRLVTGARVARLIMSSAGLVAGAEYVDPDGGRHRIDATVTVLAANAIGTARLLLNSACALFPDGVANSSGLVGKRLMVHPFANVTGYFDEPMKSYKGHWGSKITCYEFYETDTSRGFLRGAKWSLAPTGGPLAAALPMRAGRQTWGTEHHAQVAAYLGRTASWGIFGEDLPDESNRVELDDTLTDSSGIPAPRLHYAVSDNSRKLLDFHIARAVASLEAAGAYRTESEGLMRFSGWHLLGTARMGSDPQASVVDAWGRTHDVPNLYIVDGSVFVTSGGVNPTSTIAAFALKVADGLVERHGAQSAA